MICLHQSVLGKRGREERKGKRGVGEGRGVVGIGVALCAAVGAEWVGGWGGRVCVNLWAVCGG